MKALLFLWYVVRTAGGALGFGIRLLDYRPVEGDTYDATRWFTVFFFPLVPLKTWRIRPRGAEAVNLGAAVETRYNFEFLKESSTPASRIVRMVLFAWVLVPLVLAGPLAGALWFAQSHDGGAPSPLKTVLLIGAAVWGVVVMGLLNHRRERLYDWESSAGQRASSR